MKIKEEDCRVDTISSMPLVRVTHLPSNNSVYCDDYDNQKDNFDRCLEELEDLLSHYEENDGQENSRAGGS